MKASGKKKGRVYLVGAGPGEPGLITVRGLELIKTADCIICDKLANPALLNSAGPNAKIIHVPKRIGKGSFTQDKINKLIIEQAAAGKIIVRLKGGDPCIFGRGAEEAAVLADAGIDFEIVPGITAGIAAAEYAGIMLTDRKYSSQVVFVTGREADGKQQSNIDWQWLAHFGGTIVFYMAMGNLDFITRQLIKYGMKKDTPAAVIADATLPGQRCAAAPLRAINEKCRQEKIKPPAIVIIGAAAGINQRTDWCRKRPLFGKTIVVTRDEKGNEKFASKIIGKGGNPINFPTIKIRPLTQSRQFSKILGKITGFDWIIFTSANGVNIFFDFLQNSGRDARIFGSAKIAAVGDETAAELHRFGITADFVPSVFTTEELGRQLNSFANLKDSRVLVLRSGIASNELIELLGKTGAYVENVAVYSVTTVKNDCSRLTKKLTDGTIDWLTFASPSSARAFFEQIRAKTVNSGRVKAASIGPVTSEQLKKLRIKVDAEAVEHTIDGLLDAIERFYK